MQVGTMMEYNFFRNFLLKIFINTWKFKKLCKFARYLQK